MKAVESEFNKILNRVLEEVKPTEEEEKQVMEVVEDVISILKQELTQKAGVEEISLEGSFAKGTWIRGKEEADIFVQFNPRVDRETMASLTIKAGKTAVEKLGGFARLRYAEHPYVEGIVKNIQLNIVPCYRLDKGWKTAVDRTPHHTKFVKSNLTKEQRDQVRLLKALLQASNLYGAEIRVGGFSGYVTELMIVKYKTLENLLKHATTWKPPVVMEITSTSVDRVQIIRKFPNSPLIIPDPVDENRNAASAVTLQKLSEFILLAKLFIEEPSSRFFHRSEGHHPVVGSRNILGVFFEIRESKPPDILWGELLHSLNGVTKALEVAGFKVWRYDAWSDEKTVFMLFELEELELPGFYLHKGPEVFRETALGFVHKHVKDERTIAGPWVSGNRIYVLKKRTLTKVDEVLKQALQRSSVSLSHGLKRYVTEGAVIIAGYSNVISFADEHGLRSFVEGFLCGRPSYIDALKHMP